MAKKMQVKISTTDKLWGNFTGKYDNKKLAPCIQCCGNEISRNCDMSQECEFWKEYAFRRRMIRKLKEETLSKRG